MRYLLACAVLIATAGPARADDGHSDSDVTLGAGTFARWYHDTSAAGLTPDRMFGPRLAATWRVVKLGRPVLSVVGTVAGGTSEGQIFQSLDTHIDQLAFTAGPRLELDIWRGISAAAELAVGAAKTHVRIGSDTSGMAPVDDSGWHAIGSAALGVGYNGHIKRRFTIAIFVELGWTVTQQLNIHANPQSHPDPDLSIDTTYASLGHLDTGGLTGSTTIRFGF